MGKEEFVNRVKNRFFAEKVHIESPDSKKLAPDKENIQELVCKTYGIRKVELFMSRRGIFNEPRNISTYLIRMLRSDGLIDSCKEYNLKKYSSESSIVESVKKEYQRIKSFVIE